MALDSMDPATGDILGTVETHGASAVQQALDTARHAQAVWGATSLADRTAVFDRFRADLLDRRDEAARLVSLESGKPRIEAMMADVLPALEIAKHLGRQVADLAPRRLRLHNPLLFDRRSWMTLEPVGAVGVIAPWNYPLAIPATGVLTALAAGNAVVLKPSEHTPLIGAWLVDRLHAMGVPRDVLQVVQGRAETGETLAAGADAVVFTGSVQTGQKVAAACAGRFVPTCLELGGKDPMVVLPGAPEGTVSGAVWGAFSNAGQTCASVERLYLPRGEHDAYRDRIVATTQALRMGTGADVDLGPMISDDAVRRVRDHIRDAEKRGATVACGGSVRDDLGPRFLEPTVLTGVDHTMRCMAEETFGPTLPIMAHDGVDDAVRLANDSAYGLTGSVWGPKSTARAVADRLAAGTVMVNECVYTYAVPETPWGGWKDSGQGTSHGPLGLEHVTRVRHHHEAPGKTDAWHFPYGPRLERFLDGGLRFLHGRSVRGGVHAVRNWRR